MRRHLWETHGWSPRAAGGGLQESSQSTTVRWCHEVTAIIHESYGGFAPGAVKLLHKLGSQHGAKLGHDELTAPWCARSFRSFHSMCISVALHPSGCRRRDRRHAVYLDTAVDYGAAAH